MKHKMGCGDAIGLPCDRNCSSEGIHTCPSECPCQKPKPLPKWVEEAALRDAGIYSSGPANQVTDRRTRDFLTGVRLVLDRLEKTRGKDHPNDLWSENGGRESVRREVLGGE